MLNLDVTSAIYTASILDKKFGNKYSGGLLNAKVSDNNEFIGQTTNSQY